jgi:hypothetical protein
MPESIEALQRANPRTMAGFGTSVETVERLVCVRIAGREQDGARSASRQRLVRVSVAGALLALVAAGVVFVAAGALSGGPGVEDASAAVRNAATLSAGEAERSGTAVVRITHRAEPWAGTTVRWHGDDLSVSNEVPTRRRRPGSELLVVDGTVYGIDPEDGGWVAQGSPANIDPGSGTTPAEYLAAVREDVGGATLKRITGGMTGLETRELADGSTVYSGAVEAGLVARETGLKGDQAIRVLPFGYVAHAEAADASSPLDTAVTVGPGGVVRKIEVTWGTWSYTVTYSDLGVTPPLVAPANARSLLEERLRGANRAP